MVITRGSQTLEPDATTGMTTSPDDRRSRRHFRTIDPEVSLNFGHRNGWSYISGGLGRSVLVPSARTCRRRITQAARRVHYGAGARWFTNRHVALSLDFRWYSVAAQDPTATSVAQPRTTLLVLSGGIGLR